MREHGSFELGKTNKKQPQLVQILQAFNTSCAIAQVFFSSTCTGINVVAVFFVVSSALLFAPGENEIMSKGEERELEMPASFRFYRFYIAHSHMRCALSGASLPCDETAAQRGVTKLPRRRLKWARKDKRNIRTRFFVLLNSMKCVHLKKCWQVPRLPVSCVNA